MKNEKTITAEETYEYAVMHFHAGEYDFDSDVADWFDSFSAAWEYARGIKMIEGERVEVCRAMGGDFDDYCVERRMEDGEIYEYYNGERVWISVD